MHPLSSASGSRSSLRASSASLLVFVLGNSLGVNCSFWVNVELASLISVINRVRLRRLFGRQHQLLGQCRVREPHQRHQLFSYSSALRASTLAFGSRSSSRASFSLSIIPRLRLIGCHLQLLGVKNTLFLELHWRHRLSSSSARRASPSASGSKSSSRNSSTSMIVQSSDHRVSS